MAKESKRSEKSAQTRQRIVDAALAAFREHGFEQATMRDIAKRAGMSLGAAYYYFPSKEALVHAYYHHVSAIRSERAQKALEDCEGLRKRLQTVFEIHLDTVRDDRRLLAALTRFVADPESDLSVFSESMSMLRNRSLDLFYDSLSVDEIPEHLRDLGALALWTMDLGLMLYAAWDESEGLERSHKLVGNALDILVPALPFLALPIAEPFIQQLARLLMDANLVPSDAPE